MGLMPISGFSDDLTSIAVNEPLEKSLSQELLCELQEKIRLLGEMLELAMSLQSKQVVDLTELAQQVIPSVVLIETKAGFNTIFGSGDASGSGCVISPDGYIVTNHHVIDGAKKINVIFNASGLKLPATLVGSDPETDVALLKIDAEDLSYSKFGDSKLVKVGSPAVLVGNPLDIQDLLTFGVVGGKSSTLYSGYKGFYDPWDLGQFADYLISDAQCNPGNSGGPLFNVQGDIIGVCARMSFSIGGGTGMHIQSNTVAKIASELKEKGYITRASLGAQLVTIKDALAPYLCSLISSDTFDLWIDQHIEGLFVAETLQGSPAHKAGLQKGDIILRYNNIEVTTPDQFFADLSLRILPGSDLLLSLIRDGEIIEVAVPLGKRDVNKVVSIERLGIGVENLHGEKYYTFGLDSAIEGVFVSSVALDSDADYMGLRPADVITGVVLDGQPEILVKNVDELLTIVDAAEGNHEFVLVVRSSDRSRPSYVHIDMC